MTVGDFTNASRFTARNRTEDPCCRLVAQQLAERKREAWLWATLSSLGHYVP